MSFSEPLLFWISLQSWALWAPFLFEAFSSCSCPAITQSWFPSHLSDSSFFVYLSGFLLSIPPLITAILHWLPPVHLVPSFDKLIPTKILILSSDLTSTPLVCLLEGADTCIAVWRDGEGHRLWSHPVSLESQLCHLLAVWRWARYLTSLFLSSLTDERKIIRILILKGCCED